MIKDASHRFAALSLTIQGVSNKGSAIRARKDYGTLYWNTWNQLPEPLGLRFRTAWFFEPEYPRVSRF